MVSEVVPNTAAGWVGYGIAALIAVLAFVRDHRKNDVDESAVILSAWKELMAGHKTDMAALKDEFATYKRGAIAEIDALRTRLTAVEKEFAEYRITAAKEVSARDDEIAGLRRAIIQNSGTTALYLGREHRRLDHVEEAQSPPELQDRIDRLGAKGEDE